MHAKLFWIFLKSNGLFIKQTDAVMRFLISIPLTALCNPTQSVIPCLTASALHGCMSCQLKRQHD